MRRWYIALAFLLILLHPFTVAAHSGGTDSHGGHHDGDDYHYHHGYPAHNHWDMDGDGDLDCPYYFDDKTGQNSGSSGGSASILKPRETKPVASTQKGSASNETESDWPMLFVEIGLLSAVGYGIYSRFKK